MYSIKFDVIFEIPSTNGINWTTPKEVTTDRDSFQSLRFINGQFILVNYYDGELCFTTDGVNWTSKTPISDSYFYDIAYGNGRYVAVGRQGYIAVLTDDFEVESYQWINTMDDGWRSIVFANGKFVVVGNQYVGEGDQYSRTSSSTDGINWTPLKQACGNDVTYGNGKFVSVGNNGGISVSSDGETWERATVQDGSNFSWTFDWISVTYKNGKFIAVGHEYVGYNNYIGIITTSIDGTTWTTPEQLRDELENVVTARLSDVCAMP